MARTTRDNLRMDHPVVTTLVILALVAFMYFAAEVLKPLALAVLLSFALAPLVKFFEGRGLPRAFSVVLAVLLTLGAIGGVGLVVYRQLDSLSSNIAEYKQNIKGHLGPLLQDGKPNAAERITDLAEEVTKPSQGEETSAEARPIPKVEVVSTPSFQERLQEAVGPYLEAVGIGFFVLILVLFILMNREDLSDRIVQLFGRRQVSITTRTMDEVGRRISRYLATLATVNSTFGLVVGLGLWAIGVPYAVLWGFLAAALRFIPYVGPASAFLLPLIFSIAYFEGWREPLMVLGLFGVLELIANSFLEPVIYGKTTGVSALGLLVAAMFWTWLWGALGLLLSTPLTVCLAVLGKYVPSLGAFATLLGEEAELEPDVRFYQRLLAVDQEGASDLVDELLKQKPRVEVFDQVLLPALTRAERDFARSDIDDREQAFIWRVTSDILTDLEGTPEMSLEALAPQEADDAVPDGVKPESCTLQVAGVPTNDNADTLALRMLALVLAPSGCTLEIVHQVDSPLKLAEQIATLEPDLVLMSHLPPVGLTPARYLVRRLRARLPKQPIVVARWTSRGETETIQKKLGDAGASKVVFSLAEAREHILAAGKPREATAEPVPALGPVEHAG